MNKSVCVIGLGYVGLPLALLSAEKGYTTYGLEVHEKKAEQIRQKHPQILVNHPFALKADVVIIAVPSPVDERKMPDLTDIRNACNAIAENLDHSGRLIILESTVNPFVSRKIILPIFETKGFREGRDFYLAHCPERVDPGNKHWNVSNIPRVVGGVSEEAMKRAMDYYKSIVSGEVMPMSSIEAAEMVKIYENSFRAVNIAYANEMAIVMQNLKLDAKEILKGVKTKPFGLDLCQPSCGVGGHCFDKNHVVFYLEEGVFSVGSIQEVFEKFQSKKSLQVLSFDLNTHEVSFEDILHATKRQSEKIISLKVVGDYTLNVTDLHPVIVFEKGKFLIKNAKDVKSGEKMVVIDFSGVKGQKLREYLSKQKKEINYSEVKDEGAFFSVEIESVKEKEYNDFVYSLEIDKTHTLIVDNGLVAHNCIPVDPFYLIDESMKRGFDPRFLATAMKVNGYMPSYTVSLLMHAMNDVGKSIRGSTVGILGVSYKKNVEDLRESPALDIIKRVHGLGATLKIFDPYVLSYSNATAEEVLNCDAVMLLTDHDEFLDYDYSRVPVLIDGKNALEPHRVDGVYKGIGRQKHKE